MAASVYVRRLRAEVDQLWKHALLYQAMRPLAVAIKHRTRTYRIASAAEVLISDPIDSQQNATWTKVKMQGEVAEPVCYVDMKVYDEADILDSERAPLPNDSVQTGAMSAVRRSTLAKLELS